MKKYNDFIPYYTDPNSGDNTIIPDISEDSQEDGRGWLFIDKILGITERGADIFTYLKTGEKPANYGDLDEKVEVDVGRDDVEKDWTGMRKPWGTILVLSITALVGFGIYKMAKKK